MDLGREEIHEGTLSDPLSEPLSKMEAILEEEPASALIPEELVRNTRSLLLTPQEETTEKLVAETQNAAAKAIPSLVRVKVLWRDESDAWQYEMVNAVCMDGDGLYATSWSRVSKGEVFRIQYQDGSLSECMLDSFDPTKGVALLRSAEPKKSKPAAFANGLSIPFGRPLLFIWLDSKNSPQAVRGHLSGVKYEALPGFSEIISGYLQPDLSLHSHQVGGMLVDGEGGLAGMLIEAEPGSGYTSVLSVEDIVHVCRYLKQLGFVSRSDFGIYTQKLTPDLAVGFGLDAAASGVLVTHVREGLPADLAGIQVGDLIVELNDRKVMASGFFQSVLSRWPENKAIRLGVQRSGEVRQLELTGITMPKMPPRTQDEAAEIDLEPVAEQTLAITGEMEEVVLSGQKGKHLVVKSIDPRQIIFSPTVRAGDVIIDFASKAQNAGKTNIGASIIDTKDVKMESEPLTAGLLVERILNADTNRDNNRVVVLCYRNGQYFWASVRPASYY